jgi:hypothetical protein
MYTHTHARTHTHTHTHTHRSKESVEISECVEKPHSSSEAQEAKQFCACKLCPTTTTKKKRVKWKNTHPTVAVVARFYSHKW